MVRTESSSEDAESGRSGRVARLFGKCSFKQIDTGSNLAAAPSSVLRPERERLTSSASALLEGATNDGERSRLLVERVYEVAGRHMPELVVHGISLPCHRLDRHNTGQERRSIAPHRVVTSTCG